MLSLVDVGVAARGMFMSSVAVFMVEAAIFCAFVMFLGVQVLRLCLLR